MAKRPCSHVAVRNGTTASAIPEKEDNNRPPLPTGQQPAGGSGKRRRTQTRKTTRRWGRVVRRNDRAAWRRKNREQATGGRLPRHYDEVKGAEVGWVFSRSPQRTPKYRCQGEASNQRTPCTLRWCHLARWKSFGTVIEALSFFSHRGSGVPSSCGALWTRAAAPTRQRP